VRRLPVALTLAAPAAGLLLLGSGVGWLPPAAVLLGAAAAVGVGALVWRPLGDLDRLRRWLERRGAGIDEPVPALHPALGDGLALLLDRFVRRVEAEEREARETVRRAARLLDALPDPLLTIDADGRILRDNAAARELFGTALAGRPLTDVVRHPDVLRAVDRAVAGAEAGEAELHLPAPVERELHCRVVRLAEAGGRAEIVLALRDFTQMRRIERMRADFVANASHELRTPLATVAACVETLSDLAKDDPEAQQRFMELMQQQTARMTRLVEDLLSLSRIEINEHTVPTGRVALAPLLQRVAAGLALRAEAAGVAVSLAVDDGLPDVVGEAGELEQVFQNLIDNAVKYGAAGGRVEVTAGLAERGPAGRRGPAVRIAVRDFGPGIEAQHLPRLTERFYRVDTACSRALGGTGLGLAIVKHIVSRHRGTLAVDSAPGRGSTFAVTLPASG